LLERCDDGDGTPDRKLGRFLVALDTSKATYSVGWLDATAMKAAFGRGILEEGEPGAALIPKLKIQIGAL